MILRKLIMKFPSTKISLLQTPMRQCSKLVQEPEFLGIRNTFTNEIKFVNENSYDPIPIYRILNFSGEAQLPSDKKLDNEFLLKMYKSMVTLNAMDKVLYEAQRQGRISFYMTHTGEEALQIGSAAALSLNDIIYAQYREAGVLLWRGFKLTDFMDQCYGNCDDRGKGRQMPVHYGSRKLNYVTISSPLTTQLPQAVGSAYAFKRSKVDACAVCYFGDGAASEGDAHAAFNFAATLQCPIIFVCRNNGYAVSTPVHEQLKGDGIAAKGPAYGIHTIRVDGNDILAMYHVMESAKKYCLEQSKPVLIEAMTYRVGPHSTSDDGLSYRTTDEIAQWHNYTPIFKFYNYLEKLGIWNKQKNDELNALVKKDILFCFTESEKKLKPNWKELFKDVYAEMPDHIKKQMLEMEEHIRQHKDHYPLEAYQSSA